MSASPGQADSDRDAAKAMVRSGGTLILSAGVLTVSGFAFWLVVGRYIDDQSLGQVAALVSLVLFLSGVTRLNMAASLPAILTGAGRPGRRLLTRAYTLAAALGVSVSSVVVALSWIAGRGIGGPGWLIPVYVVAWSIFSMQDGALVAADASRAVAIENTAYSLARLAMAVVALTIAPSLSSAMIAWFLPLVIAIPFVNRLLWKSLDGPPAPAWSPEGFGRLVVSDFFGSIAILASTRGFAYLAVVLLPADQGPELAVAWLFFITVDVAFLQASNALASEASRSPDARNRLARSAVGLAAAVGAIGGLVGVAASPVLLGLLLEDPSSDVVAALRFIFIALAVRPIVHVWLAEARAKRDHGRLTVGPILVLGVIILAVTPGFVSDDMVLVAAGVAVSQWFVAMIAWIDLRFNDPLHGLAESLSNDISADDLDLAGQETLIGRPGRPGAAIDAGYYSPNRRLTTVPTEQPAPSLRYEYDAEGTPAADGTAPGEVQPPSPEGRERVRLAMGSLVAGAGLLALSVRLVDYDKVDGLGLIRALPIVFWLSVVCTAFGFVVFLLDRHRRGAAWSVALLTVSLHGIEPMSAPVARFSVAWLLSGFSEVVAQTGTTQRLIDARFSWPGFFLGPAAAVSGRLDAVAMPDVGVVAGLDKALYVEPLIRFWPLGVMAVWVLVVWAFARHWFPTRWFAAPLAAWMFSLLAWTGQDYFSPQSMGVTLTAVIVLLIGLLEPDIGRSVPWTQRLLATITIGGEPGRHPAMTALILILAAAVIVSHPLSPVFLTLWLIPMAVAGYRYARGLPLLVFVSFLTWVSGAAQPWWSSRISSLVGNVGAVGATISESTTARAAEASVDRSLVLLSRAQIIVLAAEFAVIAAYYLWRYRGHRSAVLMVALASMPALAIAGQPYGGEILVRVFLFSLFPICVLLGAALDCVRSRRILAGLILVVTLIGAPAFIINRFGNESFEMTTLSDHRAISAMYEQSPADTLFLTDDPFISWGYTRFQRVEGQRNHRYLRRLTPEEDTVVRAVEAGREAGFGYVAIVTADSQESWGESTAGRPEGWLTEVATYLEVHPDVTTLYRSGTSGAFLIRIDDSQEQEE